MKSHTGYAWLHWNMRDVVFGFDALAHRHRVLGGKPADVPDTQRVDLAALLPEIYGPDYIEHPRLEKLAKLNGMTMKDFVPGGDGIGVGGIPYGALHQSTLRKVELISEIANREVRRARPTAPVSDCGGGAQQGARTYRQCRAALPSLRPREERIPSAIDRSLAAPRD